MLHPHPENNQDEAATHQNNGLFENKKNTIILFDLSRFKGYIIDMATKETAIRNIQKLPDSLTWANIIEDRIRFLSAIDNGMDDTTSGKPLQYEDIKKYLYK